MPWISASGGRRSFLTWLVLLGAVTVVPLMATQTATGAGASGAAVTVQAPAGVGSATTTVTISATGFEAASDLSAVVSIAAGGGSVSLSATTGLTALPGYVLSGSEIGFFGSQAAVTGALANLVQWTRGSAAGSYNLQVWVTQYDAGVAYNPANGHFYERQGDGSTNISWLSASNSAATFTRYGMQGHLATITSAEENVFIRDKAEALNVWIGATDDPNYLPGIGGTSEGKWFWATGPEAGTQFTATNSADPTQPGAALAGQYAAWAPGEPNDVSAGGEHCAAANWGSLDGLWVDLPCDHTVTYYMVEYDPSGGGSTALTASSTVSVTITSAPDAPATPTVQQGVGQVTLTWTAPADNGFTISDYVIQYSTDGSNWITVNDGIDTTAQAVIAGLSNGVPYQFRVAAVSSEGTGAFSTATSAVTLSPAIAWSSTSPLPGAKVSTALTQPLAVLNGVGGVTYTLVSGSLPPGLSISGSNLVGTPTTLGTSTFTLRATDGRTPASTADREFTVQIVRGTRTPALQSASATGVSLGSLAVNTQRRLLSRSGTTMSYSSGQGGSAYSYQTDQPYAGAALREGDQRSHTLSFTVNNSTTFDGRSAVSLASAGTCSSGNSFTSTNSYGVSINATTYCSVFGPEVYSASFVADAGESLSFRWAAAGGGDDYETYAFLVNQSNSVHTLMAYGRGLAKGWTVASGVVPADGTYRFRFVNGSFDYSGGWYLGATMYVDPVITVGSTQTITFPQPATQGTGTTLDLTGVVTATSGLTVSLTSNTTGVCTVSGLVVTMLNSASTCTITANQAGNSIFVPAASVTRSFTVGVLNAQTISFTTPADRTYGDEPFSVNPTVTSGLAVSVVSLDLDVCEATAGVVTLVGVGTCELFASQSGGGSYAPAPDVTRSFTVAPKPVTFSGLTAVSRDYNGSTVVSVTGTPAVAGVVGSDSVTPTGSPTGALHTSAAGVGRSVTVSGLALLGTEAGRYTLSPTMLSVTIDPLTVTVALTAGLTNEYDGDTSFTLAPGDYQVGGVLNGESITVTSTIGTLDERHAGSRDVTVSGLTFSPGSGTSLGNYTLASMVTGTVTVTPKPLTLSGVTAVTRHYDGTTVAAITGTTLVGVTGGDTVSVDSSSDGSLNVGDAGTQTLTTRVSLTGTHVGNYTVVQTTAPVVITPRPIMAALAAGLTRVYDGTTTAALTAASYVVGNVVGGETLTVTNTSVTLPVRHTGTHLVTVSALNFAPGSGTSLSNYALPTSAAGQFTVTPKTISVDALRAENRPYDGSRQVTVLGRDLLGVVDGDDVRLVNGGVGTIPEPPVGQYRVTYSLGLAGDERNNYTVAMPPLDVVITPRLVSFVVRSGLERTYDGSTRFPLTPADVTVTGLIPNETLTFVAADGVLDSRNAGARTVTVASPQVRPGGVAELTNYQVPASLRAQVTVNPLTLTVDGAQVRTRRFDGTIAAAISGGQLVGVVGGDRVRLENGTTGTFTIPNAGTRIPVSSSMTLGGVDAENYRLVQPSLAGEITRARAAVALGGDLLQEADGSAKFLIADTTPAGLSTRITYNGIPLAPSVPGQYTVTATITDPNYDAATATVTLTLTAAVTAVVAVAPGAGTTPTVAPAPPVTAPATAPTAPPNASVAGGTQDMRTAVINSVDYLVADQVTEAPTMMPVLETPAGEPMALTPMESLALVNGAPSPVSVNVVEEQRVTVDADGYGLALEAKGLDGQALPVDGNGHLRLNQNGVVNVDGEGFAPGSRTEVWMFSTPMFLGFAEVTADGSFAGRFSIPGVILAGQHTIQLNGVGPNDETRSVSLGVVVESPDGVAVDAGVSDGDEVGSASSATGDAASRPATVPVGDTSGGSFPVGILLLILLALAAVAVAAQQVVRRVRPT